MNCSKIGHFIRVFSARALNLKSRSLRLKMTVLLLVSVTCNCLSVCECSYVNKYYSPRLKYVLK